MISEDPAHHIPNQTEIAIEEFYPKSLLRKQHEIDFIESHIQILHLRHSTRILRSSQEHWNLYKLQRIPPNTKHLLQWRACGLSDAVL